MDRIALTDGSGRWFDRAKAKVFEEGDRWNGSNFISLATGSQWDHEALFRTAGGRWVLQSWSQYQGSPESWGEIGDIEAAAWLVRNKHEPHEACAEEYASLEIK